MSRRIFNKDVPSLRPSECKFCGKILGRKATLLEHIQDIHKKTKKIICTVGDCNYRTNRVGNYNLHLEKVHKIVLPVTQCYTPGCGKRSRNESSLIKHMRKCKGNPSIKTIRCTEKNCREEFLTEKGLKNHLIIKHNLLESEVKEEKEESEEGFFIEKFYREVDELLFV